MKHDTKALFTLLRLLLLLLLRLQMSGLLVPTSRLRTGWGPVWDDHALT